MPTLLKQNPAFNIAVQNIHDYNGRNEALEQNKKRTRTRVEAFAFNNQNIIYNENQESGEIKLRKLQKYLDSMPLQRREHQITMHEAMIRCSTPGLYGEEFGAEEASILKQNNWDFICPLTMVSTPRRFGKSIALAMYVAAYMMVQPNCNVLIFSTGKRISEFLADAIMKNLLHLLGLKKPIRPLLERSGEIITYNPNPNVSVTDKRVLRALPASSII